MDRIRYGMRSAYCVPREGGLRFRAVGPVVTVGDRLDAPDARASSTSNLHRRWLSVLPDVGLLTQIVERILGVGAGERALRGAGGLPCLDLVGVSRTVEKEARWGLVAP